MFRQTMFLAMGVIALGVFFLIMGIHGMAQESSSSAPFIVTKDGHIQEPYKPAQKVTVNPQATFIILHRTLDPYAVLCIEDPYGAPIADRLPSRTCKTITEWVR